MSMNTKIAWTGATWNPITVCSRCSPGCTNCHALKLAHCLTVMRQDKYKGTTRHNGRLEWTGRINFDEDSLDQPRKWKTPRTIFVNSMSDLFHENIPDSLIQQVFAAMHRAPHHRYQILTKRSERLLKINPSFAWPAFIWMGVTVEDAAHTYRIDHLRSTGAHTKFLSIEPLLGPIPDLNLAGIHWVIVGGESGPKARPTQADWVRDIRDQCVAARVPFFFKQWGRLTNNPNSKDLTAKENGGSHKGGRLLDGRTWNENPAELSTANP